MFAGDDGVVWSTRGDGEEVGGHAALNIFPVGAAVVRSQNNSAPANRVAALSVGKRQRIKALAQILIDSLPVFARIFGAQNGADLAHRDAVLRVSERHVFKPAEGVGLLKPPRLSRIFGVQHDAARADDPADVGRNEINADRKSTRLNSSHR